MLEKQRGAKKNPNNNIKTGLLLGSKEPKSATGFDLLHVLWGEDTDFSFFH